MIITDNKRDTYAHYWTWLDDHIVLSKDSLREGSEKSHGRRRGRAGERSHEVALPGWFLLLFQGY